MEETKQLEMIFETQRNVAILSRDIESIKQDIKEFKDTSKENLARIDAKLEKLINEPQEDYKKFKDKIISLIISGVAVLIVLGFGTYCTKVINETNDIKSQYEQYLKND